MQEIPDSHTGSIAEVTRQQGWLSLFVYSFAVKTALHLLPQAQREKHPSPACPSYSEGS